MKLSKPFLISSRLMPAVKVGGVTISYDRETANFILDHSTWSEVIDEYKPGASHNLQQMFSDILFFLLNAVDSGEGFGESVLAWARIYEDDIMDLNIILEGERDFIVDE
jgi:hypothetical protein